MTTKYDIEIFEFILERDLIDPPEKCKCEHCEEESIYVEPWDVSYRHHSMEETIRNVCIYCRMEIVQNMDSQWLEYYAGCL